MNLADWTLRTKDGTEYAIDAEGNVLLPEGYKITKGESFTVGPCDEPEIVRIPNGVTRNPARPIHFAAADFMRLRVEMPEWYTGGTQWSRYSVEDDEVKVERIDPRTVYFNSGNIPWDTEGDRRFTELRQAMVRADPPRPYAVIPQFGRRTPVAIAAQIALDGSVN